MDCAWSLDSCQRIGYVHHRDRLVACNGPLLRCTIPLTNGLVSRDAPDLPGCIGTPWKSLPLWLVSARSFYLWFTKKNLDSFIRNGITFLRALFLCETM